MIPPPSVREAKATLRAFNKAQRKARPKVVVARPFPGGSDKQKRPRVRNAIFLAWVRRLPCIPGQILGGCEGPIEACHLRAASYKHGKPVTGMQIKPDDQWCWAGCRGHHRDFPDSQHSVGETAFWARVGIDPFELCKDLFSAFLENREGSEIIAKYAGERK